MHVFKRKTLVEYWMDHPDAEQPLKSWYAEVKKAVWTEFSDIREKFRSADPVGKHIVIFNIGGNKYRLVTKVQYRGGGMVFIKFVGTHAEYSKIKDVEKL